jgi:hypothetical protein
MAPLLEAAFFVDDALGILRAGFFFNVLVAMWGLLWVAGCV